MENTNIKETFGQRLSRLRKNKGYTQEDIAERECVSPQAVSKWENDITSPDIQTIIDLSVLLDVSLDELMGKEPSSKGTDYAPEKTKDLSKILLRISVIDKDDKINLNLPIALVKAFLKGGEEIPVNMGGKKLDIDFNMIMEMVESGVIGEILTLEEKDGATIKIFVE